MLVVLPPTTPKTSWPTAELTVTEGAAELPEFEANAPVEWLEPLLDEFKANGPGLGITVLLPGETMAEVAPVKPAAPAPAKPK